MIAFKRNKISSIGRIVTGKTPPTDNSQNYGTDYMFIGPTDLNKHFIIHESDKMISTQGLQTIKGCTLDGLSILVGCIGWDMGNVALVEGKCATNQQINSITNIKSDFNPYYIYYWLSNKKQFLFQQASVTRTPILNKTDFSNIEIPTPDRNYQDKVVQILYSIDKKIEVNNRINAELEAMAKTIYDYWFVQFDFPNKNGKPYKASGGKMVLSEELKREIPEGWEVQGLGEIINIYDSKRIPLSRSQREKKVGNIPYYGATSIMGYVDEFIFNDDYILLAEDGSVMDDDGFPIVQFIWGKTWVNNHAHVIQAKNKKNNEYVFYLVKTISVIQIMSGSIQLKINQENLRNVKVCVPNDDVLERFASLAIPIRSQLINKIEENQKLTELRDWLLPMLMNGQIKIQDAERELAMAAEPEAVYKSKKKQRV